MRAYLQFAGLIFLASLIGGCGKKDPGRDYSQAPSISITLGVKPVEDGILLAHPKDTAEVSPQKIVGMDCDLLKPTTEDDAYLYFKIAPSFKKELAMDLKVTVEYYDIERSSFWIEYDGWDKHDEKAGAYTKTTDRIKLSGNPTVWLRASLLLPRARLRNRQNDGGDFCIRVAHANLFVHAVTVEKYVPKE